MEVSASAARQAAGRLVSHQDLDVVIAQLVASHVLDEALGVRLLACARSATQTLGPGDALGEIALLLTGQRTATVVARTPMRLLSLSRQGFERIRARVPELERSLRSVGLERAGR